MGMAASQARLLTLTARLADNELRSQTINNAKMRLATESSRASENYINALNNATLKFASYDEVGNLQSQALTFNALTAYSANNTQYGLVNSAGQLLVSESEAAMFKAANGNLNEYLKAHGLEYNTTYFDNVGDIRNPEYPTPFKVIPSENLQQYYEEYVTYQMSKEVEDYEKSFTNYTKSYNTIVKELDAPISNYLTAGYEIPDPYDNIGANTVKNLLKAMRSAYSDTKNTYCPDNDLTRSFLKGAVVNGVDESGNPKITYPYHDNLDNIFTKDYKAEYSNVDPVGYTGKLIMKETGKASGNRKSGWQIGDDMTIKESTPGVWTITPIESPDYDENGKLIEGSSIKGEAIPNTFSDLTSNIINFTYQDPGDPDAPGQIYNISFNIKTGSYTQTQTLGAEDGVEELRRLNESILENMKTNFNYDEFAEYLIKAYDNYKENTALWVLAKNTTKNEDLVTLDGHSVPMSVINMIVDGKITDDLKDALYMYTDNKKLFFLSMFEDGAGAISTKDVVITEKNAEGEETTTEIEQGKTLEQLILNGIINEEELADPHYVLTIAEQFGLKLAESFNTVVKSFIVDSMIAEYGEPKYAWVDANDTQNTGNADTKAQWYTNLFKRMQQGYKTLEDGLAASKEWIEYAMESGLVTMEQVSKSFIWNSLDYKTCTKITEETDNEAVAKAEAEYTRAMNDIEAKDNIFDLQLKNIDTEHSAIQQEYDSVKNVIGKNIERTMKFDQNG